MFTPAPEMAIEARRIVLSGRVQGVGYRPFVHALAARSGVTGWVRNGAGEVEIHAQARTQSLDAFVRALIEEAPPLARPRLKGQSVAMVDAHQRFVILPSVPGEDVCIHLPPDRYTCDDCLRELDDPGNRRYRHPFINCTQCGPRYTLIARLPYDRNNTAMAGFALCGDCRREYEDPHDRRFHAEPIACPACGPQLEFVSSILRVRQAALARTVDALRDGLVVAVKGIGGYHLMCDATRDDAVARLRAGKPRPHKPLAVLLPRSGTDGLDAVRAIANADEVEMAWLGSKTRPIVLLRKRAEDGLSHLIAPGLAEVGVMLPYSPLHDLLVRDLGRPLVATSANLGGEPVLTDAAEVEQRLAHVADAFLHHDRRILRPADDSVYRVIAGSPRPLRLGRGVAPVELELPFALDEPLLAVGAHMKNTIALAWDRRVVISPHIGDLGTPRSLVVFDKVIEDLQSMYAVSAARVLHDAHPDYGGSRYARHSGLPATGVFHHRAHASALAGEYPDVRRWLVFAWDGVGLGEDGSLWGSEVMLGRPGAWQRVAAFRPFRLPGGDRAAREPWRSALGVCWEAGLDWDACPGDSSLLRKAWERGINAPLSCGAGRLFDAAAALTGVNFRSSYEGQGPMMLESLAIPGKAAVDLCVDKDQQDVTRIDWSPLLPMLLDESLSQSERASIFHASLARAIVARALAARAQHGDFTVGLTGGVFQNRLLTELALTGLRQAGLDVLLPLEVPANDAGISYGQIIEYAGAGHHD
jgi:hydrogenase maturation protein HypF